MCDWFTLRLLIADKVNNETDALTHLLLYDAQKNSRIDRH
jgi:hypothetical protein